MISFVYYFGIGKVKDKATATQARVHACFARFDPFLLCFTFLTCSDFLVFRDLPVSPMTM